MFDMMTDVPKIQRRVTIGMSNAHSRLDKTSASGRGICRIKQRLIIIRGGIVPDQMPVVPGIVQPAAQIKRMKILFFIDLENKYIISRLNGDDDLCSGRETQTENKKIDRIAADKWANQHEISILMTKIIRFQRIMDICRNGLFADYRSASSLPINSSIEKEMNYAAACPLTFW